MNGYGNDPDDPRVFYHKKIVNKQIQTVHISTFNRRHKARDHYMKRVGDNKMMSKI